MEKPRRRDSLRSIIVRAKRKRPTAGHLSNYALLTVIEMCSLYRGRPVAKAIGNGTGRVFSSNLMGSREIDWPTVIFKKVFYYYSRR